MRLKKEIAEIKEKIDFLVSGSFEKAKKYDEQTNLLKKIKFDVKKTSLFADKNGLIGVEIEYSMPKIQVFFDEDGEIVLNETFFAINKLDLITYDDMKKINEKLKEAKIRNLK